MKRKVSNYTVYIAEEILLSIKHSCAHVVSAKRFDHESLHQLQCLTRSLPNHYMSAARMSLYTIVRYHK